MNDNFSVILDVDTHSYFSALRSFVKSVTPDLSLNLEGKQVRHVNLIDVIELLIVEKSLKRFQQHKLFALELAEVRWRDPVLAGLVVRLIEEGLDEVRPVEEKSLERSTREEALRNFEGLLKNTRVRPDGLGYRVAKQALDLAGLGRKISVDHASLLETSIVCTDASRIDACLVTRPSKSWSDSYSHTLVLPVDGAIESIGSLRTVMEHCATSRERLLIACRRCSTDVLAILQANCDKGLLDVLVVTTGEDGASEQYCVYDLAKLAGVSPVTSEEFRMTERFSPDQLGHVSACRSGEGCVELIVAAAGPEAQRHSELLDDIRETLKRVGGRSYEADLVIEGRLRKLDSTGSVTIYLGTRDISRGKLSVEEVAAILGMWSHSLRSVPSETTLGTLPSTLFNRAYETLDIIKKRVSSVGLWIDSTVSPLRVTS